MCAEIPEAIAVSHQRRPVAAGVLALASLAVLGIGVWLTLTSGEGRVDLVRVTKHGVLPESFLGSPDYYVTVSTNNGKTFESKSYDGKPIGNGLDFDLDEPLPLEQIDHLALMDEDLAHDDIRDRVDVRGRKNRGQIYEFELIGPPDPNRQAGHWCLGGGGALLVLAAILLVRTYAI